MLAPLGIDHDIEPLREPARIETVNMVGIDRHRIDAQSIGIKTRIPKETRVRGRAGRVLSESAAPT